MRARTPSFLTGQMAGRAFVHILRGFEPGPPSVASVGRNERDGTPLMPDAAWLLQVREMVGFSRRVLRC